MAHDARSRELEKLIRPLKTASYEVDTQLKHIKSQLESLGKDYGGLEMNPDFQRGYIWTEAQKTAFIENILRGVIPSSAMLVQFNCPNFSENSCMGDLPRGFQCIDGLQRITAVYDFLDGKVKPFGLSITDLDNTSFDMRRGVFRFRLAIHDFKFKADLLQHYLDYNTGGTVHSADEIERVKKMRDAARKQLAEK